MKKMLRTRDRILLGLAFVEDIFIEVRSGAGYVGCAYLNMYGFTPEKYKRKNLYMQTQRMLRSGLIERVIEKGEPKFRISSDGIDRINRSYPLFSLQKRKWDGKWRVVLFDIPEKERGKRDYLRNRLKELGFGMVQISIWISPHPFEIDVKEMIEYHDLEKYVYLFVSRSAFAGNTMSLVNRVWNLEKLNTDYRELVEKYVVTKQREFMIGYLNMLIKDPFLPHNLLPKLWWGNRAREIAGAIS